MKKTRDSASNTGRALYSYTGGYKLVEKKLAIKTEREESQRNFK